MGVQLPVGGLADRTVRLNIPLQLSGYDLYLNSKYGKGHKRMSSIRAEAIQAVLKAAIDGGWEVTNLSASGYSPDYATLTMRAQFPIVEHVTDEEHYKAQEVTITVTVNDRERVRMGGEEDDD
jgi:hypothetical protein